MQSYNARKASFASSYRSGSSSKLLKWPHPPSFLATPKSLAAAGFYFNPSADTPDAVSCFMCDKGLAHWDPDDDPSQIHAQKCPTCAWAMLNCVSDVSDNRSVKFSASRLPLSRTMEKARLATFGPDGKKWWPHDAKNKGPTSKSMAKAGFIYTPASSRDDTCMCVYCGIELSGWQPEDDPMEEHRKRRAKQDPCPFFVESNGALTTTKRARSKSKPPPIIPTASSSDQEYQPPGTKSSTRAPNGKPSGSNGKSKPSKPKKAPKAKAVETDEVVAEYKIALDVDEDAPPKPRPKPRGVGSRSSSRASSIKSRTTDETDATPSSGKASSTFSSKSIPGDEPVEPDVTPPPPSPSHRSTSKSTSSRKRTARGGSQQMTRTRSRPPPPSDDEHDRTQPAPKSRRKGKSKADDVVEEGCERSKAEVKALRTMEEDRGRSRGKLKAALKDPEDESLQPEQSLQINYESNKNLVSNLTTVPTPSNRKDLNLLVIPEQGADMEALVEPPVLSLPPQTQQLNGIYHMASANTRPHFKSFQSPEDEEFAREEQALEEQARELMLADATLKFAITPPPPNGKIDHERALDLSPNNSQGTAAVTKGKGKAKMASIEDPIVAHDPTTSAPTPTSHTALAATTTVPSVVKFPRLLPDDSVAILTEAERAMTVEQWIRHEMDRQYEQLRSDGRQKIDAFKARAAEVARQIEQL